MNFPDDFCPKRREDLLKRDLEDGCVLYDQSIKKVFTLNTTAALIWEYCDGSTTIDTLAQELSIAGGKKKEEVLEDVKSVISDFQEKKLLQIENEAQ